MTTLDRAKKISDWVVAFRRDFHEHPEPSNHEERTSQKVLDTLKELGIPAKRVGKTGVLGTIEGSKPGKVILLRADMDALSITEETGLPYSSKNPGFMHACGHDSHTAMLLGAARLLWESRAELKGTVKLMFQPAEEVAEGAKEMVAAGVLKDPKVDMAFGMHIFSNLPVGKVVIQDGFFMASGDMWKCSIKGVSCHGSTPWEGADAIVCAAAFITSVQTVVSRKNDVREPIVVNVGTIQGGDRFNITPGWAKLDGMNRAFSAESRKKMPVWMEEILKNTCAAYGCTYEFEYTFSCGPTTNEPVSTAHVRRSVSSLIGEENILTVPKVMGSEDFSEYIAEVPGMLMILGGGNKAKGCVHPQHSCHFQIDEDAFPIGVAAYTQVALDYLK
jgi:amidohydrolase